MTAQQVPPRRRAARTLLPKAMLSARSPRRVDAASMTSSCSSDATWIISVISAIRCCRRLASVTCVLAGRSSTTRKADDGTIEVSAEAMSSRIVGRSRLPSLPTCNSAGHQSLQPHRSDWCTHRLGCLSSAQTLAQMGTGQRDVPLCHSSTCDYWQPTAGGSDRICLEARRNRNLPGRSTRQLC